MVEFYNKLLVYTAGTAKLRAPIMMLTARTLADGTGCGLPVRLPEKKEEEVDNSNYEDSFSKT